MARLRTAVIGVGHLGKEHARILAGLPEVELVGVADIDFEQAAAVARRCGTSAYRDHRQLLSLVAAATIAVPTTNHFLIAGEFLERGIPLLVEKPLADTHQKADALVQSAHAHGAMLQVGHIERYNPAYEEARERGLRPRFVECERLGPFSGRSTDIGVVLDLMIHDLDLLLDLIRSPVQSVEAVGWTVHGRQEDVAHARVVFADGCEAHLSASRASVVPRRQMRLWGDAGYAALDLAGRCLAVAESPHQGSGQAPSRSANSATEGNLRLIRPERSGDQLTRELRDFVDCVQTGVPPRVTGEDGCAAIALATRILDGIRHDATSKLRGRIVPWSPRGEGDAAA
jgi:predicted dehydrogenase